VIAIEDQGLGEAMDIVGTPFRLHYQSDRMPGRAGTSGNTPFDTRELGLGGWTLDVHHAYPYYSQTLFLGDGQRRSNSALGTIFKAPQDSPHLAAGERVIAAKDGSELYVFESSPSDRHLRTLDALTGTIRYRFGYGASNWRLLTTITDGDGNVTRIEHDATGMPIAIIAPFGQRTALAVDAKGYLSEITNPAGEIFEAEYSTDGLLTRFTDPRGNTRRYTYDSLGRLIQATDPGGGTKTLGRTNQPQGHTVTLATALGRSITYQVENTIYGGENPPEHLVKRTITLPSGFQATSIEDPVGVFMSQFPDGLDTEVVTRPDPRWGRQVFLPERQTITTPGGLATTISATRTVELADPANPLSLTKLTDNITLNGGTSTRVFNAATRTETSTSAAGRQSTAVLDALGRVAQVGVGGLLAINLAYDPRGRLASLTQGVGADTRTAHFSYNSEGDLLSSTDALGSISGFEYDAAGRLTRQTLPNGQEILYSYDASGNMTSLTPPGRSAHVFTYTPVDLQGAYMPPAVAGSGSTLYTYNLDQDLTRIIRPDGQTLDVAYDGAGRLRSLTAPTGQFSYAYDVMTGMLQRITTPDGDTLDYTSDGALLTKTRWAGTVSGEVDFAYDNDFRVTSMRVNGGEPITLEYDADSLLVKAGSLSLSHRAENGLLVGSTLGGVSDSLIYNGFGEITDYRTAFNGIALIALQSTRDQLGRITQKVESLGGVTDTFEYTYDVAGHLIEVTKNGMPLASYTYDANGNRLTGPVVTTLATYDAQDRLLESGGSTYTYTGSGELASKTTGAFLTAYQYDVLGNLKHVTLPSGKQIDYVIDGQNRRIGKKVNGVLVQGFLYQGRLNPIAELDGANNVVSRFVYASWSNVPDYMIKGGTTYRIVTDHLGSPRLVVNTTDGTIAQRLAYDEFGNMLLDNNPGFQPFGFAGGLYDLDTRLVRFGARDYDAEAGRWTAKEPLGFAGGDSNLYAYVGNDPVNFVDPSGLQSQSRSTTLPEFSKKVGKKVAHDVVKKKLGAPKESSSSKECRKLNEAAYDRAEDSVNPFTKWLTDAYNKANKAIDNLGKQPQQQSPPPQAPDWAKKNSPEYEY
jgi:RHS repeat-associated protein